tara:strand:+ start:126 stop:452 length:327 start_codon:yes stop_codon:yes gene_type:complete
LTGCEDAADDGVTNCSQSNQTSNPEPETPAPSMTDILQSVPAGQPQELFNMRDLKIIEHSMGIIPQDGILPRLSTLEKLWGIKNADSKSLHDRFADILAHVKQAGISL